MGRKPMFSKEVKVKACKEYLSGKGSFTSIGREISVAKSTMIIWVNQYKKYGPSIFDTKERNKIYTKEFKAKVILEYLNGVGSQLDLALKYGIPSRATISKWIIEYNKGIEIKDYDPKGDVYTMKARKVSCEEKLEIIQYVLDNDKDYKGAADKYSVPYHNVYNWFKKYLKDGEEGLIDKRGRPKEKIEPLTEVERLQLELQKKENEIARLNRAIEALKKNEEIQAKLKRESQKLGMNQNIKQSKSSVKTKSSTSKN